MTMLETVFAMCHELLHHGEVSEAPGVTLYPASVRYARGGVCFLARTEEGKALWAAGGELPALFYGRLRQQEQCPVKSAPLDAENARVLTELFPQLRPVPLAPDRQALRVFDPLGRAASAVLEAAAETGAFPVPVMASVEDLALLGATYDELLAAGVFAALEQGGACAWGAEAGPVGDRSEALYAADCAMTCITLRREVDEEQAADLRAALEAEGFSVPVRPFQPGGAHRDTPWLEAMRLIAIVDPTLYRLIHDYALEETQATGLVPLRERTDLELAAYLDQPEARAMLADACCGVLTALSDTGGDRFKSRILAHLDRYEAEYTALVKKRLRADAPEQHA